MSAEGSMFVGSQFDGFGHLSREIFAGKWRKSVVKLANGSQYVKVVERMTRCVLACVFMFCFWLMCFVERGSKSLW